MSGKHPREILHLRVFGCLSFLMSVLCALVLQFVPANATSTIPVFDFYETADRADAGWILSFNAKSGFALKEVLMGQEIAVDQWKFVEEGMKESLSDTRKNLGSDGPLEVVVFPRSLNKGTYYFNWTECVVIDGDAIRINGAIRSEYTRSSFKAEIQRAASLKRELASLLRSDPTPDRLEKIVSFLMAHDEPPKFASDGNRFFNRSFSRYLGKRTSEACELILQKLAASKSDSGQRKLIDLLGSIVQTSRSFDVVTVYLERTHSPEVRRSAIRALDSADTSRAFGAFLPYLTVDEPELYMMLTVSYKLDRTPAILKNPAAVKPLVELASAIRKTSWNGDVANRKKISEALLMKLSGYGHPGLVSAVSEWAADKNDPSAGTALFYLNQMLEWPVNRGDNAALNSWWERNKSLLNRGYELNTLSGLESWLGAMAEADTATQKALMRFWNFEAAINESALIESARRNLFSREVLAKLWAEARLSVEARKTIVKNHLSFHLVRVPTALDQSFKNFRSLQIAAKTDFPFPAGAIIHYSGKIALESEPQLGPYRTAFSLSGISRRSGLTIFTGFNDDNSKAYGTVGLREIDEPSKKSALLWELEWRVEPLDLGSPPK